MSSQTRIAVPLVTATPSLAQQADAARVAGADLVELRVDQIGDIDAVERFLAGPPAIPVILTIRTADEGGAWQNDDVERAALFTRLARHRPALIDVEHARWTANDDLRRTLAAAYRIPAGQHSSTDASRDGQCTRLILSHHDFARTPADVAAVFDRLARSEADVLKAVFSARDSSDAFRVLAAMRPHAATRDVIGLAMGEAGVATRVLARKFGAFLTFATVHADRASAPGQPDIATLRDLYRWDELTAAARVFGVVGWPVSHSQSPELHNAALRRAGIDAVYLPLPVAPDAAAFAAFMNLSEQGRDLHITGLSVTLPHKEDALRWVEQTGGVVTPLARRCGAANTLQRRADGVWLADNTDVGGALDALRTTRLGRGRAWHGLRVAVLGAGGVARAVVAGLCEQGCEITLFNRTAERARTLADEFGCAQRAWCERGQFTGDVLINCTSVGLWPQVDASPMPAAALHNVAVVFDTIYRPPQTQLLQDAAAAGCEVVTGNTMFIRQAAAQMALWHGPGKARFITG